MRRVAYLLAVALASAPAFAGTPSLATWKKLETPAAAELARDGYVEERYELTGKSGTTKLVLRRPADPLRFLGTVHLESLVKGAAPVWAATSPYDLQRGIVWVGIEGDAVADAAWTLRSPDGLLAQLGLHAAAQRVQGLLRIVLVGWGEGACQGARFLNEQHAAARRPDDRPLVDAYLLGACPVAVTIPKDAPVLQVATESDYRTPSAAAMTASFRKEPGNEIGVSRYRWYDIAGIAAQAAGEAPRDLKCAGPVAAGPERGDFLRAMLRNVDDWLRLGLQPPGGNELFELADDKTPKRDPHGNVVGGLRPWWVEVPSAAFVPCDGAGTQKPLARPVLAKLYKDNADHQAKVLQVLDRQVQAKQLRLEEGKAARDRAARTTLF